VAKQVKPYVYALMKYNIYPLHKFLVVMSILEGTINLKIKTEIRDKLLTLINDPIYRFKIKKCKL
jgi:hypothetical protein